jgi:hypothetical protein
MQIIHYIFYLLPYIFLVLIIYMTDNLIRTRQKTGRLNIYNLIAAIIIPIVLTVYYLPNRNILKGYTLNYMNITVHKTIDNHQSIEIKDKEKVDKLLSIINKHTFIRSAARTVKQQNFADSLYIMIGTSNKQPVRLIQLYVLKDNIKNNALEINDQMYNVREKSGLSEDIFNVLKEFGALSN